MHTTWDQIDHDPSSIASAAAERPTVRMRHMSMTAGGWHDSPTDQTYVTVHAANTAIAQLAQDNDHAMGGVVHEPDPNSLVNGAMHVIIHWGLVSDRYHLDLIEYARPQEN